MPEISKEVEVTIDLDGDDVAELVNQLGDDDQGEILEALLDGMNPRSYAAEMRDRFAMLDDGDVVECINESLKVRDVDGVSKARQLALAIWEHLMPLVEGVPTALQLFATNRLEAMSKNPGMWATTVEAFGMQLIMLAEMHDITSPAAIRAVYETSGASILNLSMPLDDEWARGACRRLSDLIEDHNR